MFEKEIKIKGIWHQAIGTRHQAIAEKIKNHKQYVAVGFWHIELSIES